MGVARCIMGFAGHMVDRRSRTSPRFPESAENGVRIAIRSALLRYQPRCAVSSAACGGDIIFAEEAQSLKIPTYIILPFEDREEFIDLSVEYAGMDWVERFHKVCLHSLQVFHVHPGGHRDDKDFEDNQHAVIFFTLGFGGAIKTQVVNLILYDATQPFDGPGGTKSFLDLCEHLHRSGFNLAYELIDMAQIRNQHTGESGR